MRRNWQIPSALFLGTFLLAALTISNYGITWDEPGYFYASDLHMRWFGDLWRNLFKGEAATSLADGSILASWRWNPYHVPHPPFSRVLSGITETLFSPFLDSFIAYRLAPTLLFALLVTVMYLWMAEIFGSLTGLFAALTLVLIPNLFGFAHFAVTDMPLAVMWFLTVYCFWRGLKDWRWSAVLGLVWGLALSTKFPAIVIPIPLFLWAHLFRRQAYGNNVFSMFFLGPIIMIVVQPYLWHDTFLRILEFLFEGVSRTHRPDTNYPVFFDNQPLFSKQLPWYYSFFITGVTTPEIFLALAFVGVSSAVWLKPQRDFIILFVFNALFVPTLGLLPGAVLHDGVRQLMSALPFLGGLAGGGFFALAKYVGGQSQKFLALQRIRNLQPKLAGILFILFLFPPALDLFVYHPYELSYYNRLVGGIRGAFQRGLEVTYFMEAFTPEFLGRLNKELPPNAVINAAISNFMFEYYQQRGRLRPDIRISDENFEYVVLLNRRSVLGEGAKSLIENVQPHEALRLDGVPLILIYKVRK